ncbi:MAG TPA: hypothetical protein VFF69_15375 [Phycisphaerales bacterium]|nr:hypothetical protein [Phycisphaerales bacterium]
MRRAFSILELTVVAGITAVLVAISVPGLAQARRAAADAVTFNTLRHVVHATSAYAGDNCDHLPFLATPREPWQPIQFGDHKTYRDSYFLQSRLVLTLVVPAYFNDPEMLVWNDCDYCADVSNDGVVYSSFWMTDTAFAAPRYWEGESTPDDLSLYRGMRVGDSVFPSAKGLVIDAARSAKAEAGGASVSPYFVARCDASAGTKPFDVQEYADVPVRPYAATPWPVMFTWDGFSGRDF